jgi:RNA polymerase primary sigma factor
LDLSKYYAEICKAPILSKEEEKLLIDKYKDASTTEAEKDKLRDKIITSNLRFAFKQAKIFSKNEPGTFEELISAANEGLLVGLEKYNPESGVRFLSYAGWWVNQRILDEMANMRIVSLPKWRQQLAARITKAVDKNDGITLTELKTMFAEQGVAGKDVEEMHRTKYLTYYLDDLEEHELCIDPIGEEVQKNMDEKKIWKSVSSLPSPHREIIARAFGLDDGEEHSIARMSKDLKLTREEVQRIKAEGMALLKTKVV